MTIKKRFVGCYLFLALAAVAVIASAAKAAPVWPTGKATYAFPLKGTPLVCYDWHGKTTLVLNCPLLTSRRLLPWPTGKPGVEARKPYNGRVVVCKQWTYGAGRRFAGVVVRCAPDVSAANVA